MNSGNIKIIEELRSENGVRTFRAMDSGHDSPVIVKVFESPLLRSNEGRSGIRSRVKRWQSVDHPAVLKPLHVETEAEKLLLVLPLVPTGSLEDRLRMGVVSSLDLGGLSGRVSQAVQVLHDAGMAHGNLKPTNLLFDDNGDVLLTDLDLGVHGSGRSQVEAAGEGYRAPEVKDSGRPTPESDQYSWALILLTVLTRRGPREALQELADIEEDPPSGAFSRHGGHSLSRRVAEPFRRALAHDPSQRFGSMLEFDRAVQVALGYKEATPAKPTTAKQVGQDTAKTTPKKGGRRLRLVALFVLPLLCILGAVPAFSSDWAGSLMKDFRAFSSGYDQLAGEETTAVADTQAASQGESLPPEWTEAPQDSELAADPPADHETEVPTESGTEDSSDNQQVSEPTQEGSQEALPRPEATDTAAPTVAPTPTPAPTDQPTSQPTSQPTATPTQSTDNKVNPSSCKSDPNHPRYCTPTPGS